MSALRLSTLLLPCALLCAAGACGGGSEAPRKGSYTLRLFDYEPGAPVVFRLREAQASAALGGYAGTFDPQGNRTIVIANVLEAGKTYWAEYFIDANRDGRYAPPTPAGYPEPSWRRIFPGDPAGFEDSAAADQRYVDLTPY